MAVGDGGTSSWNGLSNLRPGWVEMFRLGIRASDASGNVSKWWVEIISRLTFSLLSPPSIEWSYRSMGGRDVIVDGWWLWKRTPTSQT